MKYEKKFQSFPQRLKDTNKKGTNVKEKLASAEDIIFPFSEIENLFLPIPNNLGNEFLATNFIN